MSTITQANQNPSSFPWIAQFAAIVKMMLLYSANVSESPTPAIGTHQADLDALGAGLGVRLLHRRRGPDDQRRSDDRAGVEERQVSLQAFGVLGLVR